MNVRLIPSLFFAMACIGLWQYGAGKEWINPMLYPPPSEILKELLFMWQQTSDGKPVLLRHILISLQRLALALALGSFAGIAIGVAMGLSNRIRAFFDPLVTFLMPIPGIAMAPLFILWLGFGNAAIITVAAIAVFFPVAHNTAAGLRSIDTKLVQAASSMGANRWSVLKHVYLPWSASFLIVGLKLGMARGWRSLIAVELIAAASWGLGYMIWDASENLRTGVVYGGILLLGAIFLLLERAIFTPLEALTIERWGMSRK